MSGDLSLFGDDQPHEAERPAPTAMPIAEWQIDLLRKALDARGVVQMAARQQVIEAELGRPVASLRGLTHDEALRVLAGLGRSTTTTERTSSQWDDREEATWIDRL